MIGIEGAERRKVHELAERYEAQGFRVAIEPAPSSLPFELGGYRPDLIAHKGDQHLIIEVRGSGDRIPVERYRDLAEEVGRHPGWRFLLVTMNDVETTSLPGTPDELAPWHEVTGRVARSERFLDAGDSDAAILLLWSAFEAILRHHAASVAIPLERLPGRALLKHLYSLGELSMDQFDRAMTGGRTRNRLAHGFPTPQADDAARDLLALVKELLCEWCQDAGVA